ncbi:MAG TPA: L-histidine N(alpha)-methyltransferase [Acidimicrobiales bacterium]|nr:L-histidine N(alpha)-methyltransferase [Acidimicrobiales bacterium]
MTVDVHLGPTDMAEALRADVQRGLTASPKWLPPKWFYDERGSRLFDDITRLPEYYPTRCEQEILAVHASDIAAAAGADTLVELGSGTSTKTRVLLDAMQARCYVPFDVSEATLREAGQSIEADHPGVSVHGVVGDFERHLGCVPAGGRKLVAFLGGTIGNLRPTERKRFLADVLTTMAPGDAFLLGTDLAKDEARLVAAYDDSAGVTAEFNRNVLHVLNRELDGDFLPERFDHVARWDGDNEWVEMRLRSQTAQSARLAALDMDVAFETGEDLHTEISTKFRRERVAEELGDAGLELRNWWTDAAGDFALSLSFVP